jgi:ERF superfamily
MNRSESIINLAKALLKFQSSIGTIKKDAKNPHFKSNFASLSGILDAVTPVLSDAGLVVLQHPSGDGLVINLETILIHAETGEYMSSEFSMRPAKTDPQGIGSCITYMRRYALGAILELNIDDDDDDGNAASQQKQPAKQYSKPGAKAAPQATFETVKAHIEYAQSMEDLEAIGKDIAAIEKTAEQRTELAKAYKERMEYIKGGEEM